MRSEYDCLMDITKNVSETANKELEYSKQGHARSVESKKDAIALKELVLELKKILYKKKPKGEFVFE